MNDFIIGAVTGKTQLQYEVSTVNKFGYNPEIDTTTDPEDIWDGGGIWTPPTTARVHAIVSSSANDTAAGTGARTMRVIGLDSNNLEIQEDITLNGVTPVNTTNSYTIIYRMYLLTAGSGEVNAGTITATAATDATVTAQINIGRGQTLMAIYCVPDGYTGLLTNYYASITRPGTPAGDMAEMTIKTKNDFGTANMPFRTRHIKGVSAEGNSTSEHRFNPPLKLESGTLIKLTGQFVTDNDSIIYGGFDLWLIKND